MIRILLVDDQKTVRESIRAWLEPVENFKIVGTASDGHSAIEQVEILKPDVVLIDLEMPELDGIQTTSIICQKFIEVKVIILSMYNDNKYVSSSLQAGATGYLLKNTPKEELIKAISFVNLGYSQFAPGLINKVFKSIPESQTLEIQPKKENGHNLEYSSLENLTKPDLSHYQDQPRNKPIGKKSYLQIWLLCNLIIWGSSIAYLQFKKPTYTSNWAIALPVSNSFTNIDLPGVGQASSESETAFNSDFSDPRENYKYLAETEEVLKQAAKSLGIDAEKFGKPKIEAPANTNLIKFKIDGEKPEIAVSKAIAVQNSLQKSLRRLRTEENDSNSLELENTLTVTNKKLQAARQKLAQFKISSGLSSIDQNTNLTFNIEQLRKQRAEIVAQERKTKSRFDELCSSLGLSSQDASDALILQSDPQFKEYLDNYGEVSRELVHLKAKFSATHPAVVNLQAEQDNTETELYSLAESLLGKPFNSNNLKTININSNDFSQTQRANLFQELISLDAEQGSLAEQAQSLTEQISELETKLAKMSQFGSELEKLQREVQLSEAVFSSTATKLDLAKSQTSASYPPVSLISSPTLPKQSSSPRKELVLLGSLLSSALLTTGLFSHWSRNQFSKLSQSSLSNGSSNSNGRAYHYLPPVPKSETNAGRSKT
ncbi:MAG: hypothetical protein RLZZ574_2943 [Cyanobacteriota bacterium]